MGETISIEEFKKESKRREFKEKIKNGVNKAYVKMKDFCISHQEIAIPVAVTLATGAVKITKLVLKHQNLKQEEHNKEEYCYDRSLGHYWALRRPLSNKEWLEIDSKKRNGERLSDILSEMKVLK